MHSLKYDSKIAFTLVEVLVAMVVLVLILLSVTSLINSTTVSTNFSNARVEADLQARTFLDYLAVDLKMMPVRSDFDYQFIKNDGAASSGLNDRVFFYTSAAGYSGGMLGSLFTNKPAQFLQGKSPIALVGYMIDEYQDVNNFKAFQAIRFGNANLWLTTGSTFKGVNPLSSSTVATTGSYTPDSVSTIFGSYGANINKTGNFPKNVNSEKLWQVVASGVIRFEFNFLLTDGSYSTKPLVFKTGDNQNSTVDPKSNDKDYRSGAKWWNGADHRSFICTYGNGVSPTVWRPYGMTDVAGVTVSIATLDSRSRALLKKPTAAQWSAILSLLPDAPLEAGTSGKLATRPNQGPQLPAEIWQAKLKTANVASIPPAVVRQIRVYQRSIPLNSL